MLNNPRFKKLLENYRFFDIHYSKLLENPSIDYKLLGILISNFVSYVNYYNLSDEQIYDKHMFFLNEYNMHLKEFEKTNKYPYQTRVSFRKKRIDYDISLLCSAFLTHHRYCIFKTLYNRINARRDQSVVIIGIGPGIELSILKDKSDNIFAYDTDISKFIRDAYPKVYFFKNDFVHENNKMYDKIVLIELLEHLKDPSNLLTAAMRSLKSNGRIHFTTAVNIPQFDHLYNFELNDSNLEKWILSNNFEIVYKLDIPHNYLINTNTYNCYYIIKRAYDL